MSVQIAVDLIQLAYNIVMLFASAKYEESYTVNILIASEMPVVKQQRVIDEVGPGMARFLLCFESIEEVQDNGSITILKRNK